MSISDARHWKSLQPGYRRNLRAKRKKEIDQLRTNNARLQAIVDRLPKTADGVPVTPGMKVYLPFHGQIWPWSYNATHDSPDVRETITPAECYSTPEAAEAAKEKNGAE